MFSKKHTKIAALAFCGMMGLSALSFCGSTAEAAKHNPPPPRHHEEYNESGHKKKYSEGERNTAAVLGAVVGAIIAKNT